MRRLIFVAIVFGVTIAAQSPTALRAEDDYRTVDGLRLHFVAWSGDTVVERPTIILLHGIARHAHTFDHIAPQLFRTHQVIALDMRGHGDSAWSPEGAYLVDDYVKDLEGLVDQLRLRKVSLLGNSTGGRVAQVYAGRHPDRVDKLIVEDVGPERPQSIADAFARQVEQEKNGWASEDELIASLAARNRRTPEPLLRTYAHYGVKKRDDGRLVWKRDPNLVKGFIETDLWNDVQKITAPTLYVIGGASRIVPEETQQKLKARLPNVRIVVMPGLGHYPDEEDTVGFMKIVEEFLS